MVRIYSILLLFILSMLLITCGEDSPTNSNIDNSSANDTIPPGAISNLAIIDFSDTTCLLSWTVPGDDGFNGQVNSYDVRYSFRISEFVSWESVNVLDSMPQPLAKGSNQQFLVKNLIIDSIYYFAIKSLDDSGNISSISNIVKRDISSNGTCQ